MTIRIDAASIVVSDPVRGACEILGLDPLYVVNEGRFVAFVPPHVAEPALATLRDGQAEPTQQSLAGWKQTAQA